MVSFQDLIVPVLGFIEVMGL